MYFLYPVFLLLFSFIILLLFTLNCTHPFIAHSEVKFNGFSRAILFFPVITISSVKSRPRTLVYSVTSQYVITPSPLLSSLLLYCDMYMSNNSGGRRNIPALVIQ